MNGISKEPMPRREGGKISPWAWIPTLYFAEGIPYVVVMTVALVMFKRLGISNGDAALYTSWLYLPWVIKPLWSPLVDLVKTKRWWIWAMQLLIGAGLAGIAFTLKVNPHVQAMLAFFWLIAFGSATHDIAADGFYMIALSSHEQSLFVGIRSTFYRIATIFGQGLLIALAGMLESYTRQVPLAWSLTFYVTAGLFVLLFLYHKFILPRPADDRKIASESQPSFLGSIKDFLNTFATFFTKRAAVISILFMLLYRFPEALLCKVCPLFLLDKPSAGGMGLTTAQLGFAQGTVGVIGLTIGGILGGLAASHGGLRKWLWPMVAAISIPDSVYIYMSFADSVSFTLINILIFIEQFGYGFGFTAYMLFLIYYSRGESKTAHYAICTAFMALSMMIPGLFAGYLQEALGYQTFFILTMILCLVTVAVSAFIKIDPNFGKKERKKDGGELNVFIYIGCVFCITSNVLSLLYIGYIYLIPPPYRFIFNDIDIKLFVVYSIALIIALIAVMNKKKWGVVGFFVVQILSMISGLVCGYAIETIIPAITACGFFTILLTLKKNGRSAWKTIFCNTNHIDVLC